MNAGISISNNGNVRVVGSYGVVYGSATRFMTLETFTYPEEKERREEDGQVIQP